MCVGLLAVGVQVVGCQGEGVNWLKNGLLDPTQVGQFSEMRRNEIRHTLSILEEPLGIQNAEEPTPDDLMAGVEESRIGPGDVLTISIFELLVPGVATVQQVRVGNAGFETIPMLGPVRVVGFTPRELELELVARLREADILPEADVQVTLVVSQAAQFSMVGTLVRPGTYPLPRPDFRLLDAIAAGGGIPPQVENIYVFHKVGSQNGARESGAAGVGLPLPGETEFPPVGPEEAEIPFSLTDVSSGSAGVGDPQPGTTMSGTGEAGVDGFGTRESRVAREQPRIEWDAEHREWVIEGADTRPATREAVELEDRAKPLDQDALGFWQPATATTEGAAAEPAEQPWEAPEELVPPVRIIEIPVKDLMEGDPRYNIVIRPYDLINVPAGNVGDFYMMGNVARRGAYSLTGRRLTVKEAIASAGGFGPLAWPARADLIRRVSEDEEQIIQLDLDAIFAGEAPDFYLRPSDIVNVGTNPAAVFFAVLRNAFRFSYGMGFVYDRNFADSDTFQAREQVKNRRRVEAQMRGIPY
ncbi:MAG: polysaccharide biosynthesis/export family protein [Phycisphaerae bacterium]|nr:polysaccharide biosynthesis/export family protein [Phycisphaerae bacterium]